MAKVSLRAYNREIETMIDRGHLDEAIANCRHILKLFPKHLETYRLLGKAYLEYKRFPEAADIFSRVLAAVPDDFVANVGMSIIRDEENKLDDAIWHMERAFETQPSNAAIQSELQRLYGRRDGVQPPRIRMTRGALAHMYVQGELYPQAISEIKSVLKEDTGRVDMQALLARACYRSGLKNEAADVASSVLRTYSYCLDANRVLMEILSSDRSESAQLYRQRVVELDPYAAHVSGTVFQSNEAPEAAVSVERLDWNGQPVGLQPDWGTTQAISLEEENVRDEEPAWLKSVFDEPPTQPPPHSFGSSADQPEVVPPFDFSGLATPSTPTQESDEDIPDFLRAAGWGQSTGAFDESKPSFAHEEPESEPPIAKADLPDWVKAMAPAEAEQPSEEEEALPDWINKIGTAPPVAPADADDQLDWIQQLDQPTQAQPSDDQSDWLKQSEQSEQPVPAASDDQPDWLKGFGSESEPGSSGELDWLGQIGAEPEAPQTEAESPSTEFQVPAGTEESAVPESRDPGERTEELQEPAHSSPVSSATDSLGTSEQERDDSFAWLENLAARQGATEGLLTTPEERMEEEPDWVKRAKGLSTDDMPTQPAPATQPSTNLEELGKSEQERDDSFAWLESLAAKQGASEGLLTKPEERMEEEPDWVKRAKDVSMTSEQPPSATPQSATEESSSDDTGVWLRNLEEEEESASASATSAGTDATGMWLKSLDEGPADIKLTPSAEQPESETPAWMQNIEEEQPTEASAPSAPADEAAKVQAERPESEMPAWLQDVEVEKTAEPEPSMPISDIATELSTPSEEVSSEMAGMEEEPIAQADTTAVSEVQAAQAAEMNDLPEWLQYIEDKEVAEEGTPTIREKTTAEVSEWMGSIEEPVASSERAEQGPAADSETIPAWLSSLEEEEAQATTSTASDADLPAWLRGEERSPEPSGLEPTRSTDWQPVEEEQPEPTTSVSEAIPESVEVAPETPEPVLSSVEETVTPEPVSPELPKEPVAPMEQAVSALPIDAILGQARDDLLQGDIPGALQTYGKLIRKTRLLDEVIYDLREALYRYPVDVGIWQSLGDAYMRANRLQDALDAYTKAEELLR